MARLPFARAHRTSASVPSDAPEGVFIAATALARPGWQHAVASGAPGAHHLVFDWRPDAAAGVLDAEVARLSAEVSGVVGSGLCPHAGGPPVCWCRPPLPGLILALARMHGIDPGRSMLIGAGAAHRTLATTLGARYVAV